MKTIALAVACLSALTISAQAKVERAPWGESPDGQKVELYTLTNAKGAKLRISTYGATWVGLEVPGRDGKMADVVQGFDNAMGYKQYGSMNGAVVGRYANRIGGAGNVVMFVFDAFPPVQVRGAIADAVFKNHPDIAVLDRVTPDVSDGGIADSRAKMEAILAANPEPGSIKAVWAAWDQPALGALQAIEAAGRQGEGIVITGIDANPQARDAIATGGNFEASVAQDFAGIGATTADTVARVLAGEEAARPQFAGDGLDLLAVCRLGDEHDECGQVLICRAESVAEP